MADTAKAIKVKYKFRDSKSGMLRAWEDAFRTYAFKGVEISCGDIFRGAPYADAIVSPANSFGFMTGGIDKAFSQHFGWQMQTRLQKVIREEYDGENLVGHAIIIPAYEEDHPPSPKDLEGCNDDKPIKFLISAPTMRVPADVSNTANAYLAFRAVILAVRKHNKNPDNIPIKSVLTPGLGTAVGEMPFKMCAQQMLQAYELHELHLPEHKWKLRPDSLFHMQMDQDKMVTALREDSKEKPNTGKLKLRVAETLTKQED